MATVKYLGMVSWKSMRFGMELRAFKFYSLQFFQFYTIICFRDTIAN
jgi:hypothetical protein